MILVNKGQKREASLGIIIVKMKINKLKISKCWCQADRSPKIIENILPLEQFIIPDHTQNRMHRLKQENLEAMAAFG